MPKKKQSSSTLVPIMLISLIIIGGAVGWYMYTEAKYQGLVAEKAKASAPQTVQISKGMGVSTLAKALQEDALIVDKDAFVRYAKEKGDDAKLQAGSFTVAGGLSTPEVLDILTGRVKPAKARVTIPEGLTIRDIAALLVKQGLIKTEDEMLDCIATTCDFSAYDFLPAKRNTKYAYPYSYMEGYLFPDTYFVETDNFQIGKFVALLLTTFDSKVNKGLSKELKASGQTLEDLVIMASIVEKESRPADNQAIVAGILWKRMENNIQLAADATNRYIMEDPTQPITIQQLVSTNPYNGRKVKGLPPSAISNPGLASIEAAMSPEDSEWFYYLHDSDGVIRFARTENEHERNKSQYIQ